MVYPLRVGLPERGWSTLSVQMPVLANDATGADYAALMDEVAPRLEAAIAYLRAQGTGRRAGRLGRPQLGCDHEQPVSGATPAGRGSLCLRRFATALIKAKSKDSVSASIDKLARKVRRVFDYLGMTTNSAPRAAQAAPSG